MRAARSTAPRSCSRRSSTPRPIRASRRCRPGGGPLQPGDAVLLSQLYDPGELQEGAQFGLFLIADGWNPERRAPERRARVPQQRPAGDDRRPGAAAVLDHQRRHLRDRGQHLPQRRSDAGRLANPLNQAAHARPPRGWNPSVSGLTATFEDLVLLSGDADLNDTTIQVDLLPTQRAQLRLRADGRARSRDQRYRQRQSEPRHGRDRLGQSRSTRW